MHILNLGTMRDIVASCLVDMIQSKELHVFYDLTPQDDTDAVHACCTAVGPEPPSGHAFLADGYGRIQGLSTHCLYIDADRSYTMYICGAVGTPPRSTSAHIFVEIGGHP